MTANNTYTSHYQQSLDRSLYKECALLAALLIPAEGQNMSNIQSFGVHAKHKSRAGCESTSLNVLGWKKSSKAKLWKHVNFIQFWSILTQSLGVLWKGGHFLRHTCPRDLIFCFLHRLTWLQHPISRTFSLFQWNRTMHTHWAKHLKQFFQNLKRTPRNPRRALKIHENTWTVMHPSNNREPPNTKMRPWWTLQEYLETKNT